MEFIRLIQSCSRRIGRISHPWLNGLVLGALLLPTLLYGVVAWQDRRMVMNEAQQNVHNTALILAEHANNVFETHRLVAKLVNERVRGMSWQEIATSKVLHDFLVDVIRDQPRIRSLWLIDSTGLIRNSSAAFPVPQVNVSDRDYFVALRRHDRGTFIGEVVRGRVFEEDIFNVAQRRLTDSGTFDGVIAVSALPSYLHEFWTAVAREPGNVTLSRSDGMILTRIPPDRRYAGRLPASNLLMQAIEGGKEAGIYRASSPVDGQERLFAYRKVGDFPMYVGRGINLSAVEAVWREDLLFYGGFFAIGILGLVSLAVVASRRLEQWRRTAWDLRVEIERRAEIEAKLRQSQKMEALGQLTGGIAHDFGNVLQVISGRLEMLENRPGDKRLLTSAREAASRGEKAVQSMLAFARRQPLRPEVFDLNDALAGIDSLLRQAVGSAITVSMELSAVPCRIKVDRNQMELAILNLAINARDAMPDGGRLIVTLKTERLNGSPDGLVGGYAVIAIEDTGIGMPPEVQTQALEPFFTTKEPGKGTGLGLSMVYGFSKQSGGALTIESEVGRGTSISIFLPISEAECDRTATALSEAV